MPVCSKITYCDVCVMSENCWWAGNSCDGTSVCGNSSMTMAGIYNSFALNGDYDGCPSWANQTYGSSNMIWQVIGIIFGVLFALALGIAAGIFYMKKKKAVCENVELQALNESVERIVEWNTPQGLESLV